MARGTREDAGAELTVSLRPREYPSPIRPPDVAPVGRSRDDPVMIAADAGYDVSRHKCLIYDGAPSEQLPVVVPLLLDGLRDNWRCLYLGSPDDLHMVDDALTARGIDTGSEMARSALVLSSDRSHLEGGSFDPGAMVDGLCSSIDAAVRDGFKGLCATGDMRWELGEDESFDRLLEYEARLEQVFRETNALRGICQYHRGLLPAGAVRDALLTHRAAYVGERLERDNLFYVPPEVLLQARGGDAEKHGEWMCQQILRVMNAERARDEAHRDLERRVAERTAELALVNRHLRAFSYSVSHDLRAPLRAIVGFGTTLAEESGDRLDTKGRKNLDRVLEAAHRMGDLIEGMLRLGETLEVEMARIPLDLATIAREIARDLREAEPARSVELVIGDDLHVEGDPILLRAAMTNLMSNAWKFTSRRAQARIEVGCSLENAKERVYFVRDDGAGFDMRHAEKLFGVFQRLHRQDEFAGTGVGLATVERIITRHGGRIWAEGQPGRGATFFFTLSATPDGTATT